MTEDEVLQILNLIEKSTFDFLQLELGDLKLTVSKSGYVPSTAVTPGAAPGLVSQASPRPPVDVKEAPPQARPPQPAPSLAETEAIKGAVAITAPMVGTFYTTPEPGSPPFVHVGGRVGEDETVGLIEVMKVFNAVKSGVRGTVAKICVDNGQFVEYGQTLFLVRPEGVLDEEGPE
ncbi:MAG: acetyl-CoA carboxylase, biotin carboxyl carrier protein [Deltaproteobacteria bacterium]|nr:acetyl-CoA carboxylase, biotin carboxyl carrier protein [Deltaproteobacteria bacterium]